MKDSTQYPTIRKIPPRYIPVAYMPRYALAASLLMLLVTARPAFPAPKDDLLDLPLEELLALTVTGASRYEQSVATVPSSVTIITAEDIRRHGYRTLADALQTVEGFQINFGRTYSYPTIRGAAPEGDFNARSLVLLNGQRINDRVFDTGYIDYTIPLDPAIIERIEVIKGPGSSMYGSNAVFAVINIVFRPIEETDQVRVGGGSQRTMTESLLFGDPEHGFQLYLNGRQSRGNRRVAYDPWHVPSLTQTTVAEDLERSRDLFIQARYEIGDWKLFTFYTDSRNDKSTPAPAFQLFVNDRPNELHDERGGAHVLSNHITPLGVVSTKLMLDFFRYRGRFATPNAREVRESAMNYAVSAETSLQNENWLGRFVIGAEALKDLKMQYSVWDVDPFLQYTHLSLNRSNAGVFAQLEATAVPWVTPTIGGRVHHYEEVGTTVNPRIALVTDPWHDTVLKILYGQAYRAPNASEQLGSGETGVLTTLNPETFSTWEVNFTHQYSPRTVLAASWFSNEAEDLIRAGEKEYENQETFSARGVELSLASEPTSSIKMRLGYAYAEAHEGRNDRLATRTPRHMAKGALSFPMYKDRVTGAFDLQWTGKQRRLDGESEPSRFLSHFNARADGIWRNTH